MGVDLEIWPTRSNGAHCHPSPSCSPPESDSLSPNGARTTWRLCPYESIFFFYQPRNPWESISFEFQSNKRKYVLGTTGSRIISILIQSSFGNAETHIRLCIVSYFLPLSLNHRINKWKLPSLVHLMSYLLQSPTLWFETSFLNRTCVARQSHEGT